jgi:hypothetical protein
VKISEGPIALAVAVTVLPPPPAADQNFPFGPLIAKFVTIGAMFWIGWSWNTF